jgi:hypothetical protein
MTINPRINKPTLPFRLSWRITHTRNPVSGIKKIKKKIILDVLIFQLVNLVLNFCKKDKIKIKTATWPLVKYPVQQNHYSNIYNVQQ